MTTIAERLDQAMQAAGFTSQSALARASGVPQPTINRILKGGGKAGPETTTLVKLADACNVSFIWLQSGTAAMAADTYVQLLESGAAQRVVVVDEDDPSLTRIDMVTLRLSAGIMGFHADPDYSIGGTLSVPTSWILRRHFDPERLVAIRIKGESMEPSLFADDVVVVNTADTTPVDGQVFAVNYEGEAVVKRLVRDAGDWWLGSDNLDQRRFPRKLCEGDMCMIVGRVVRKESERI